MKRLIWLAGLGTLALAYPAATRAQATPQVSADTIPVYRVDAVSVTVTRSAARRDAVPQSIDVISSLDLERTPAEEFADVLKKHAALDVVQYPGLLSAVGVRGFRPQSSGINQRTLVLVDGRPAGVTNLALLSPQSVDRVEVLKGAASSLYGSNAMGGAINIVTRRSTNDLAGSVTLGYGSWSTLDARGSVGGRLGAGFDFDLDLSMFERDADTRIGGGNVFRNFLNDETVRALDRGASLGDGDVLPFTRYGTRAGNVRLGYRVADGWRVDVRGDRFRADRVQSPGDLFVAYDDRSLKNVGRNSGELAVAGLHGDHAITLKAYGSGEDTDFFNIPDADESQFVSFRSLARWQGGQLQDVIRLGAHSVTAGVDYTASRAASELFVASSTRGAPYEPDSEIRSLAAFAAGRLGFMNDRVVATLAGRLDRITFEVFDTPFLLTQLPDRATHTAFNPSAAIQYRSASGWRVRASGGRAFVTPQAFHVAGQSEQAAWDAQRTVDLTRGNPDLQPENSITVDAGIGILRPATGLDAELVLFRTDVRDRITTSRSELTHVELTPDGDTIRSVTTFVNADDAAMRGIEARASYDLGARAGYAYSLRAFATATRMLRAVEIVGGEERMIQNVADMTINYGVEWDDLRRLSARLAGRYVGAREDTDWSDWTNPALVTYPAFMALDLATEVRVTGRYRIGLQVSNLTDENYYEKRGFPLPGRAFRLSASAGF